MGKLLGEFVERDYREEVEIVKTTGNLWTGIVAVLGAAVGLAIVDFIAGDPWSGKETVFTAIALVCVPPIKRAWERHKVAEEMRLHRRIQIDMKLNQLLGIISVEKWPGNSDPSD